MRSILRTRHIVVARPSVQGSLSDAYLARFLPQTTLRIELLKTLLNGFSFLISRLSGVYQLKEIQRVPTADGIALLYNDGFMTIRSRIFLHNVLIVLIVVSLMTVLVNIMISAALIENVESHTQTKLKLIESNIDSIVHNVNNYIISFSIEKDVQAILKENPVVPSDPANIYNTQSEALETYTYIRGLNENIDSYELYTADLEPFGFSGYSADGGQPVFGTDTLRPTWTAPVRMTDRVNQSTEWMFIVHKKVIDLNVGQHIGYVSFFVAEEKLGSVYGSLNEQSGVLYIVDGRGRVISSSDRNSIGAELSKAIRLTPTQILDLNDSGAGPYDIDNDSYSISLGRYDEQDWDILYVVPYGEITRGRDILNVTIALIGIGCLLLSFVFSFLVSQNVSKPILQLTDAMESIQKDRLDTRIPVRSQDEIGVLGKGFNSLMDRIDGLLRTIYAEQKQIRDYEFKLIQSQINPHFLYNSLGTIESLINIGKYADAIAHVHNLTSFYRLSLSTGEDFVTLQQEFEITKSYLEIQKRRYIEYMSYEIELDEKTKTATVPKLILQPIVENAIYHGLKESKRLGLVRVSSQLTDETVELTIYDSGKGMDPARQKDVIKKDGFGLSSVDKRLKLLYGDQYGVSVSSETGVFTRVCVTMPFLGKDAENA